MARGRDTRITLSVGSLGEADLPVRALAGEEELSRPYWFEVETWTASGGPLALEDLLGQPAAIGLRGPGGEERVVSGVVARAELAEVAARRPFYRIRIVPRLELLRLRVRSRVFQDQSAPKIVASVLDEMRVPHRLSLSGSYPRRELVAQYRESSLAFVCRLLEAEGIWYRFEEGSDGEVVVLGDGSTAFADLPGGTALPFSVHRPDEHLPEHLFRLGRVVCVVPETSTQADFDFEHPALSVSGTEGPVGARSEVFEYPSGHRDPSAAARAAAKRLEALRVPLDGWEGAGTCVRLAPGLVLEPEDPPDPAAAQRLVAVRVRHRGRQEESPGGEIERRYENELTAVPASVPYRPPRRTPRPVLAGLQTAIVAAPSGEEIHVDVHGRIKVHLHWDREGPSDDGASCWVRTVQDWAGPGHGALWIPRAGQEVVLRFLEGDPDRPLVEGAVYDGERRPPAQLPHEKTQSVLRSDSSPGGGGYNELRLEDARGEERVHVHAQRDALVEVEHDERRKVHGQAKLAVGNDRTQAVRGFQALRVEGNDASTVAVQQTLNVAGQRETRVEASHAETVLGAQAVAVGAEQNIQLAGAKVVMVKAAAALNVGGAYMVSVGGLLNFAVGGARLEEVGGERLLSVGGDHRIDVAGSCEQKVGGDAERTVAGSYVSTAGTGEESFQVVTTKVAGQITLGGKKLELSADDALTLAVGGKKLWAASASGTVLKVKSLSVQGDEIAFKGGSITKEAPASAADQKTEDLKQFPVELELVDQDGEPLEGEPFRVEFPDGTLVDGVTGPHGKTTVFGTAEGQAKVSFPRLDGKAWDKA